MKYYMLNDLTDWQVMYRPYYMESKEYKEGKTNKINNRKFYEDAPIIPCKLIHKHEEYRDTIDWKTEDKEPPPLEAPYLKDVIQRSGMLSLGGVGGIVISERFKKILKKYDINEHFLYKLQLKYKKAYYDYYFLIPNFQNPYKHIDFTKTEFITKPKHKYNVIKTKKELLKPSEVLKVQNLEEYLKIKDKLKPFTYNNNTLYINKKLDFFLNGGSSYFVSERFKNHLEEQGLNVSFLELSPASNISSIIAPEEV